MNADGRRGAEAREEARRLVASLGQQQPSLLEFDGVDLSPALEQQVFFALRDGRSSPIRLLSLRLTGQLLLATGAAVLASFRRPAGDRPVVAVIRSPTHLGALRAIEAELRLKSGRGLRIVRVGGAAGWRYRAAPRNAPRLADLLDLALVAPLARYLRRVAHELGPAVELWPAPALVAARVELPRIALAAMALDSMVRRWRPGLLLALDEVGTWARLVPAVARRWGIASLDLPHAEAADPIAIAGADYDRFAVYGPRAATVLRSAGVPADRIVEIGAPRFDDLHGRIATPPAEPRRVLFAAQYVTPVMSPAAFEMCYRAALAAAAAAVPSELTVVPHPAEPPGLIASEAARHTAPPGVSVRIDATAGLHRQLAGAWLLVTGWSNSVFEAALSGVPAIAVSPGGQAPVDFAAEGLAIPAIDDVTAATEASRLLDPTLRARAVERARAALREHLGETDGRASERAARLIEELAR